jgi:hypothetical protein
MDSNYRTSLYLSHPRALSTAFVTALAQPKTPDDSGTLPGNWLADPACYQNAIVVYHPIRDVIRRASGGAIADAHAELYEHAHDVFRGGRAGKHHRYRDPRYGGVVSAATPVVFRESVGPESNTIDLQVFPDTRSIRSLPVVISIRRPWDFIASHLRMWPGDSIDHLAASYLHLIRLYQAIVSSGGQALLITAEHIWQDPCLTLQKVAKHLDVPFHSGMLNWAKSNGETISFHNNPFVYLYDESYPDPSTVRVKPWFDNVNSSQGLNSRSTGISRAHPQLSAAHSNMVANLEDAYASHLAIANHGTPRSWHLAPRHPTSSPRLGGAQLGTTRKDCGMIRRS